MTLVVKSDVHGISGEYIEAPLREARAELAPMLPQLEAQLLDIEQLPVTNADEMGFANNLLRAVVEEKDRVKAKLERWISPLQSVIKSLKLEGAPLLDFSERAETALKAKIADFTRAERDRAEAARQIAQQAAQSRDHQTAALAVNVATAAATKPPEGTSIRYQWKARIVNVYLVPKEYLLHPRVQDALLVELGQHARAAKHPTPPTPIPGVLFDEEPIVSVRRG